MGCTQSKDKNLLKPSQASEKSNKDDHVVHSEIREQGTQYMRSEGTSQEIQKGEEGISQDIEKGEEGISQDIEKGEEGIYQEVEKGEEVISYPTQDSSQKKQDSEEPTENINSKDVTAIEEDENVDNSYTKFLKENQHGCYLVYKPNDNGTFLAVFSETFVPDSLAFATISTYVTVPQYKYKTPQKVCSNVDTGVSRYYEAWCLWFIIIKAYEGKTVLLPSFFNSSEANIKKFPSMKIYVLFYDKVASFTKDEESLVLSVRFLSAVCCVSGSYDGFKIYEKCGTNVSLNDFIACANATQNKFYCVF